ncbi:MAG: FHA domain-containing protein [Candidatus Acidiferrales bacterium]
MDEPASNRIAELIRERLRLDLELEQSQRLLSILFVDIVGSTRFYDEHGNTAGLVMVQKCLNVLIPVVEPFGGMIVKTIGDAILARFDSAETAVRCAMQMERNLTQHNAGRAQRDQIHIHVGINYGLALVKENDVFGDVVNVTARIESVAESDEIVISPSVYEQIRHIPDIHVRKKASGVELKGKVGKLDLYTVAWNPNEKAEPAPPPPSTDQLFKATGLHTGLAELARRKPTGSAPPEPTVLRGGAAAASKTRFLGALEVEKIAPPGVQFVLARLQEDGSLGDRYVLDHPGMTIGEEGDIRLPSHPLLAKEHARFTQLGDAVYIEDLGSSYGVFLRLRAPHPLRNGDVILMGRQRLRFDLEASHPNAAAAVSAKRTVFLGAKPAAAIPRVSLVSLDDELSETDRHDLRTPETLFGRSKGTCTFPDDPYMSSTHAKIKVENNQYLLEDLAGTNGTFVRIRKRTLTRDGDTILIGGQLLRVIAQKT